MNDVPADHRGWAQLLARAIDSLPHCFPDGALAYLTATSKVEDPVRDAIAYFIHQHVSASGHKVGREYQIDGSSRDLAVLDPDGAAVVELEAKAMYSFNVINRPDELLKGERWHGGDASKLQAAMAARGDACFLLSLVTHLMTRVPEELLPVIKYARMSGEHNSVLRRRFNGLPEDMYEASQQWAGALEVEFHASVRHSPHELGEVYGVPVLLDCYLVGPLTVASAATQPIGLPRQSASHRPFNRHLQIRCPCGLERRPRWRPALPGCRPGRTHARDPSWKASTASPCCCRDDVSPAMAT
jgi:hypothetical protein